MKQLTKIGLVIIILTFFNTKGFSQLGVSYYSSSLSKVGLSYNFTDRVWTELRIYSNTYFEEITPELVVCFNVLHKEQYNVYAGIGGVGNVYNGIVVPVGVQFFPFEKLTNFSFHIEIMPMWDTNEESMLQSAWGLRYKFGGGTKQP